MRKIEEKERIEQGAVVQDAENRMAEAGADTEGGALALPEYVTGIAEYVLTMLRYYRKDSEKMSILEFELHNPPTISEEEMIDSMNFGHDDSLAIVVKGGVTDKTQSIAGKYEDATVDANESVLSAIETDLNELRMKRKRLDYYLSCLPPQDAEIIRLTYIDGVSQGEIAERLLVTTRTVRNKLNRAVKRLCELYSYGIMKRTSTKADK